MEDNIFKQKLKEIVDLFSINEFELAIFKAEELKNELNETDEIEFVNCLINVIKATFIINYNGELSEAYKLLVYSYDKLKSFRPFYKGLKLENFINSIQESMAEIKSHL